MQSMLFELGEAYSNAEGSSDSDLEEKHIDITLMDDIDPHYDPNFDSDLNM